MKSVLFVLAILATASMVFAAPGAVIGSPFSFGVVRGLDKDWDTGNIWMSTAVSNACAFGQFDATTHAQVGSWVTTSQYWCFDCAYGYVYSGTKSIILVDQNSPRLHVYNPTTGAALGTLPNAFPEYSYDDGIGCKAGGTITDNLLYATSYSGNPIKKSDYPCTTWSTFATCPATPAMGVGYGWGKVFVVTTSADYKIYEFDATTGSLENTWPLVGWSYFLMGLSAGRVDAVGTDESVFIATFSPSNMIYEVEVGDVYTTPTRVQPTSLGMIKGTYK